MTNPLHNNQYFIVCMRYVSLLIFCDQDEFSVSHAHVTYISTSAFEILIKLHMVEMKWLLFMYVSVYIPLCHKLHVADISISANDISIFYRYVIMSGTFPNRDQDSWPFVTDVGDRKSLHGPWLRLHNCIRMAIYLILSVLEWYVRSKRQLVSVAVWYDAEYHILKCHHYDIMLCVIYTSIIIVTSNWKSCPSKNY